MTVDYLSRYFVMMKLAQSNCMRKFSLSIWMKAGIWNICMKVHMHWLGNAILSIERFWWTI